MKRKIFGILFALVLALSLSLVPAVPVSAAVDVTAASGGGAISADDYATSTYTTLGTITIAEQAVGDIGTTGNLILDVPTGFLFDDTAPPSVTVQGGSELAIGTVTITTTAITIPITVNGIVVMDTITIGATTQIEVIPSAGYPLVSGNIYADATSVAIAGITTGPAGTNFGTLTMVAGVATQLAFTTQPAAGANSGALLGVQPIVEAQDQFTNKDTTFTETVTITADVGALSGDVDIAALGGVATFTDLVHTATADNQVTTLTANDEDGVGTDLPTVNANTFTTLVIATQLVFTTQPAGSVSGSALTTQPVVEAQDANNVKDTDYVTDVVASENDAGTLTGTLTVTPLAGVATFTDLVYTATANGEIFQIEFDSGGLPQVTSADVVSVIPTWGGWAAPPTPTIETNLFGEVFRFRFHITTRGEIRETIQATSADGNLTLTIPAGTIALDKNGNPLSTLTSGVDVSPPPPPSHIIGLAYNFGPDGATFDPAITLTWNYDPDALPEGVAEEDLVILWYDEEAGEWVECDFTCAPETDCITGYVCHFTTFAIIAHAAPAAFSASNLSIQPSEVQPKEAVTITLSVANTGGMEGSYAVVLKINDVKEAEKDVTVAAGSSQSVSFSVTREKAGSYSVAVNGLSGSFTVKEPVPAPPPPPPAPPPEVKAVINWPLVGGIIAAVVVVGLLIFFLVVRRRA